MPKQWQGGCIYCAEPRWTEAELRQGIDLAAGNVYLIRENGQKTIVAMCKKCFNLNNDDYDLEKIKENLYESELECLQSRVTDKEEFDKRLHLVEGIKDLKFLRVEKP